MGGEQAPGAAPMDVLTSVKTEGGRRRRRRQGRKLALSGLALVLLAVPVVVVAASGGDAPDEVEIADSGPDRRGGFDEDAATSETTSTTAPTEVLGVVIERPAEGTTDASESTTPTTTRPRPGTATPPATNPQLVCVNSTDPACGEFRWEPNPGNGPLSLATAEVISLAPGQSTDIIVNWADPDAVLAFDHFSTDGTLIGGGCSVTPRYGPWTPPAPSGGSGTLTYPYTAPASPGAYTVGISAGAGDCEGPYRSEAAVLVTVQVQSPAP